MKRLHPDQMQSLSLANQRELERNEMARQRIVQDGADADDSRYLDTMGWWHRIIVRIFSKHFAVFAKALIATAADRNLISSQSAKAIARSSEQRLRQEKI